MIKISVIIPIYNHEKYVIECLESIIRQNDKNYEIISIDDGSTDRSYEIAHTYLKNNLINNKWYINKRENKGINKTLNEAIRISTGEIIYVLASDDRMPDGSLEYIRKACKNEPTILDSLCFYDVSLINSYGEYISDSASNMIRGGVSLLSLSKIYLGTQIVLRWGSPFQHQLYSKIFFEKYGPYPEALSYEDLYFALKAISINKFIYLPKVLKEYRVRNDSLITPGLKKEDLRKDKIFKLLEFKKDVKIYYRILYGIAIKYYNGDRYYERFVKYVSNIVYKYAKIVESIKLK
jgi:glycosyltransferase involved in cell wall biosynthesis